MSNNTKPEDLTKAIKEYLEDYQEDIQEEVETLANKITKEAKKELVDVSRSKFKLHGRDTPYYSGWALRQGNKARNKYSRVIWNKTNYQLTHLLEFSHATRNGGRTRAVPHIRPIEQKYSELFEKELKKEIRRTK